MAKDGKRGPLYDAGTRYGYYLARKERREGVEPSQEEKDRRMRERAKNERLDDEDRRKRGRK